MKKIVYLLRGVCGCGKSSLAEELAKIGSSVICCADDYFMDDEGNYNWSADKIGSAHLWCQNLFLENLKDGTEVIIVANTSTRERDVNVYRKLALEYGYLVYVMTVENHHNGVNIHNVSEETLINMEKQLLNSIKLR